MARAMDENWGGVRIAETRRALLDELARTCPMNRKEWADYDYGTVNHADPKDIHWTARSGCRVCSVIAALNCIDRFAMDELPMIDLALNVAEQKALFAAAEKAFSNGLFWTARFGQAVWVPREEIENFMFLFQGSELARHIAERRAGPRPKTLLNDLAQLLAQGGYGPAEISKLVIDDHGPRESRKRTSQRVRRGRGRNEALAERSDDGDAPAT